MGDFNLARRPKILQFFVKKDAHDYLPTCFTYLPIKNMTHDYLLQILSSHSWLQPWKFQVTSMAAITGWFPDFNGLDKKELIFSRHSTALLHGPCLPHYLSHHLLQYMGCPLGFWLSLLKDTDTTTELNFNNLINFIGILCKWWCW